MVYAFSSGHIVIGPYSTAYTYGSRRYDTLQEMQLPDAIIAFWSSHQSLSPPAQSMHHKQAQNATLWHKLDSSDETKDERPKSEELFNDHVFKSSLGIPQHVFKNSRQLSQQ